jgi:N-acetylglucosamine-6-phosphate deacetylase
MPERLLINNCRLFNAPDDKQTTSILVEDGVISHIGQIDSGADREETLDAEGRTAAPGFIDIHIQGAGGADILDGTPEALRTISRTCARFGTTGFLATTVFRPRGENEHVAVTAEHVGRSLGGASLLGIHLEGPFISTEKKGMIQPSCICPPSVDVLDEILAMTGSNLRIMTIAPEPAQSLPIISRLVDAGVVASLGHTNATYEQTIEGFSAGISHVTHLFNAMPTLHHRSPGPLAAILESEQITAQLISDGVHIHPAVVKLAFDALGADRTIPITDGMQALGLPDGRYVYNGIEYQSKEGTARYKDGTLIGTALGLNQLLGRLMAFTGCPLEVAIRMVTENPARLLGIQDRKGDIRPGLDADLILLEVDLSVHTTIVGGEIVFRK